MTTPTATTYTSLLQVAIEGAPLPDTLATLMAEGWIDSGVNIPSAFQLTFSDQARTITTSFPQLRIGAKVTLTPILDGKPSLLPLLTGEITALEADADATTKLLVVRGYDPGHRLLRNSRVVGYPTMTASEIVAKVATLCDVEVGELEPTSTVYQLATQPNISDWDFLNRLARENGMRLYVDQLGLLQFKKLAPPVGVSDTVTALQSANVLQFESNAMRSRAVVTSSGQVESVEVRGWDVQEKIALSEVTPSLTATDIKIGATPATVTAEFGTAKLTSAAVPYDTQAEVLNASTGLADDVTSSFAELEMCVVGDPALNPGVAVALNGGGLPFEGNYTITGTRHVFTGAEKYQTWVTVTGRQVRSLYGLASGGADTAPKIPGVVSALVTNIQDPLRQGRVKLMFPWLSATYESDWCRIAQLGGVRGGGTFLPEVHDEVLCAFDRGSLDHPYVIAGLYNGKDQPTPDKDHSPQYDPTTGAVNWRSIASRSGHMVELLDVKEPVNSGIRAITAQKKLLVHLDESSAGTPEATITISAGLGGQTKITISENGEITITGTSKVSVNAAADLNLSAGGVMSIKAGGDLNLEAAGAVSLSAVGDVSVDAVGDVNLSAVADVNIASVATISVESVSVEMVGLVTANGLPVV